MSQRSKTDVCKRFPLLDKRDTVADEFESESQESWYGKEILKRGKQERGVRLR